MLLLYMSRVQLAVVLELRIVTYFLRFSDPNKSCLKYMNFSPTYLLSNQERLFISKAIKERSGICSTCIPFVGDDERSCPSTAVHASDISRSLLSPFVPASAILRT